MSSVADPNDVPEAIEDKTTAGSSNGEGSDGISELHGAEVNGYQNELEGSMAEGREELPQISAVCPFCNIGETSRSSVS